MIQKHSQADLENLITEISRSIGIVKNVNESLLRKLFEDGNYAQCIGQIARMMHLPIKVKMKCIRSTSDFFGINPSQFESLFGFGLGGGRMIPDTLGTVFIPKDLPKYGSSKLDGFPIDIRAKWEITERFEIFSYVVAHELAHIVLHSLRHKHMESEVATDLTVMILGFSDIMRRGRKSSGLFAEKTHGYLSDEDFDFADKSIKRKLLKQEVLKFIGKVRKKIQDLS